MKLNSLSQLRNDDFFYYRGQYLKRSYHKPSSDYLNMRKRFDEQKKRAEEAANKRKQYPGWELNKNTTIENLLNFFSVIESRKYAPSNVFHHHKT